MSTTFVGVCLPRSADLVIGELVVMMAGVAYLALAVPAGVPS